MTYIWNISDTSSQFTGSTIDHTFTSPGSFVVTLIAANGVSNSTATLTVIAQDAVGSISVSKSPSIVEINEVVTFNSSLSVGTDVSYVWNCGSGNAAVLMHSFASTGNHWCCVTVANEVSSNRKCKQAIVLEDITSVVISHALSTNTSSDISYAAKDTSYTFNATVRSLINGYA